MGRCTDAEKALQGCIWPLQSGGVAVIMEALLGDKQT